MCRSFKFGGNILYGTCSWHHLFSSGDARISYLGLTPPLAFLILSQCPLPFPSLLPPCTSILCSFRPSFRTRSLLIQPGKGSGERCKISACLGRQTLSAFWRFDFRPFQWSFWRFLLGIKSEKKNHEIAINMLSLSTTALLSLQFIDSFHLSLLTAHKENYGEAWTASPPLFRQRSELESQGCIMLRLMSLQQSIQAVLPEVHP